MRSSEWKIKGIIGMLFFITLAGCGKSSDSNLVLSASSPANTYLVEYVPGTAAMEGKTTFQLKIRNRSDGSPATGLSVSLVPTMHMTDKSHGTPVDVVTEIGTPGTYNCAVYYSMGDHMMGVLKGYWDLQVKIGFGDRDLLSLCRVPDDERRYLENEDVQYRGRGKRHHLLPVQRRHGHRGNADLQALPHAIGEHDVLPHLHGQRADGYGQPPWILSRPPTPPSRRRTVTAADDGNGHFSMPGLTDLSSAGTYTVYVKLSVNGEMKTTDGLASNMAGTNTYSAFKVTSH